MELADEKGHLHSHYCLAYPQRDSVLVDGRRPGLFPRAISRHSKQDPREPWNTLAAANNTLADLPLAGNLGSLSRFKHHSCDGTVLPWQRSEENDQRKWLATHLMH